MNFKSKMRRNLKVILLMAIVWAGGLLYLAKNGDKPLKQVSQIQVLKMSFQVSKMDQISLLKIKKFSKNKKKFGGIRVQNWGNLVFKSGSKIFSLVFKNED